MHMVFGAVDKVAALLGATKPLHWLTIDSNSSIVDLYEVGGRTYTLDIHPSKKERASETRVPVREMLSIRRTDTDVIVTEVTDSAVKHQVVIAYVAERPKGVIEIATGEHKHCSEPMIRVRPPGSSHAESGFRQWHAVSVSSCSSAATPRCWRGSGARSWTS
jgi:hypothetical protein